PDLIVIDFPGAPCYWLENPKGSSDHWKKHVIWPSACNETPLYIDLFGTGKRVLVMGWQPEDTAQKRQTGKNSKEKKKQMEAQPKRKEHEGQMAWFTPGKDPYELWEMHPISEPSSPGHEIPGKFRFSHGLGVGDVNGDGRLDVICTKGWWEQ